MGKKKLIKALRKTANDLDNGCEYEWGHMARCNAGCLGQNLIGKTQAEDVIWWKMDNHHHQSVIIFSSEDLAKAEFDKRQKMREKTTSEQNINMVEEVMGPILSQLSSM